jgi:hypothetical protein
MPRRDGTGPVNGIGRGMGPCNENQTTGNGTGFGLGNRFGRGRGFGRGVDNTGDQKDLPVDQKATGENHK